MVTSGTGEERKPGDPRSDAQSRDEPGGDEPGQIRPEEEDDRRGGLEGERGDDDALAAHPVGDVADEDEADDDADGIDGEDDGDDERREAVALGVERVERGRQRRVGHADEEGGGDEPEAEAMSGARSRLAARTNFAQSYVPLEPSMFMQGALSVRLPLQV